MTTAAADVGVRHPRGLRTDAERNRALVMEAAASVFAEEGLSGSIDEIATRAGVGKATIFRRFGDKDSLVAAVACHRLEGLATLGERLSAETDAGAAFQRFMMAAVKLQVADRSLCQAIGGLALINPDVEQVKSRMIRVVGELLERAQRQAAIRTDLVPSDVVLLVSAISQAAAPLHGSVPRLWQRYFDIVFDGLRPGSSTPISHGPPTQGQLKAAFGPCPWSGTKRD